ncbi:MAG: hypothetical protein ACYTGY_15050 [Planctomycetota bacterium]
MQEFAPGEGETALCASPLDWAAIGPPPDDTALVVSAARAFRSVVRDHIHHHVALEPHNARQVDDIDPAATNLALILLWPILLPTSTVK